MGHFWLAKRGKGWCDVYSQRTRFYFWGFYVCANFGENPSRNAIERVHADEHTDRGNWFYNLSHAVYAIAVGQIKKWRVLWFTVYFLISSQPTVYNSLICKGPSLHVGGIPPWTPVNSLLSVFVCEKNILHYTGRVIDSLGIVMSWFSNTRSFHLLLLNKRNGCCTLLDKSDYGQSP